MLLIAVVAAAAGVVIGRRQNAAAPFIEFERKTWAANLVISRARFMPDGKTIVFSGSAPRLPEDLYAVRPGAVVPQALAKDVRLLSVSSKGELAVLAKASEEPSDNNRVLSRMPIDGAPRPWLDYVTDADWSPDGNDIAVIHDVNGRPQIEYPIGTVRYTASGGYLSDIRVSPAGTKVAFMEHQFAQDNRGWLKLVTKDGAARTLVGEFSGENGVAWSRDGSTVVFSANVGQNTIYYQTLEVSVSGEPKVRQHTTNSSSLFVQDIVADGSVLVTEGVMRWGMKVLLPGESAERDVSWLDAGADPRISADGKKVVFTDLGPGAGANYQVAIRDVASGSVIRLGAGASWGLSPDGKLAGATILSTAQTVLYPTGPGSAVEVPRGPIENYDDLPHWFADGRRIYFCGREKGHAPRCYQQNIAGGLPEPITGDGVVLALLADDQQTLLTSSVDGTFAVGRIGSNQRTPARGFKAGDKPLTWTADGTAVVVSRFDKQSVLAERVDVRTGQRTTLRAITTSESDGFRPFIFNQWRADGKSYAYGFGNSVSVLYVVTRKAQAK